MFEEEIGFLMKNVHLFLVAVGEKKKEMCLNVLAVTTFCDKAFNTSDLSFPSLAPAKVSNQFPNFFFFLLAQNCFFKKVPQKLLLLNKGIHSINVFQAYPG